MRGVRDIWEHVREEYETRANDKIPVMNVGDLL